MALYWIDRGSRTMNAATFGMWWYEHGRARRDLREAMGDHVASPDTETPKEDLVVAINAFDHFDGET